VDIVLKLLKEMNSWARNERGGLSGIKHDEYFRAAKDGAGVTKMHE
jgi:hypothetical protein